MKNDHIFDVNSSSCIWNKTFASTLARIRWCLVILGIVATAFVLANKYWICDQEGYVLRTTYSTAVYLWWFKVLWNMTIVMKSNFFLWSDRLFMIKSDEISWFPVRYWILAIIFRCHPQIFAISNQPKRFSIKHPARVVILKRVTIILGQIISNIKNYEIFLNSHLLSR